MDFIRRAWLFTKAKIGRTILLIVAFSAILIFRKLQVQVSQPSSSHMNSYS